MSSTENVFRGEGPISVKEVEDKIQDLWQKEGLRGMTRSCTRNLIVVLPEKEHVGREAHRIIMVAKDHPSRFFFVIPDETTPAPGIVAEVGVKGHLDSARPTCCEVVFLYVHPDVWEHAHTALLTLLLPEQPVDVWWRRPLDEADPLLSHLLDVATTLVVDAGQSDAVASFLRTVKTLRERQNSVNVVDLTWARLTPWRESLAQLFDAPDKRPYLSAIERVNVRLSDAPQGWTAALYLVGWLASRLGWVPVVKGRRARSRKWSFSRGEDVVEVAVEPRAVPVPLPDRHPLLLRVQIVTVAGAEDMTAKFTVSTEGSESIDVRVEVGSTHTRRTQNVHWPDAVEALAAILREGGEDPIYREVLEYVEQARMTQGI